MTDRGEEQKRLPAVPAIPTPEHESRPDLTTQLTLVADGMVHVLDAAKFLGVGKSLLYLMMDRGELPYAKIHGRRCIPRRALHEYAAKQIVLAKKG